MNLEELKEMQQEKKNKKVEVLKPFHINVELAEIMKQISEISSLEEQVIILNSELEKINEKTPLWFWSSPKIKRNSSGVISEVSINKGYDHTIMGNDLIESYHLVRFPGLREGAVYDYSRGFWRYFGKNEMKDFVEKETLKVLEDWGYYDIKHIVPTRIYVMQKTYDKTYPSATPFETSKPELAVFRNGTYNMLTDSMKENDPNDFILNAYDYNLDTSGKATSNTDALFEGLMGENALFMKQYIGYMFYRSHTPSPLMLFLKGNGGEGKSSFIAYLSKHILGSDNVSAVTPQDLSNDKFQMVELLGKVANISADILDDFIEDSSVIKRITGGDPVTAQYKGIQGFKMVNYSKLLFSANKLPKFKDHTEGFSDRLAVVPFINGNQRLPGATFWKNHDMNKVEKEAHSFVYSCIREFMKIFDGKKAQFSKTESMVQEEDKWKLSNDHIGEFLLEATTIHFDDERGEIATKVQQEWQAFCKLNGYFPKSAQAFKDYLEDKGVPKKRSRKGFNDGGSHQWRYIGLELLVSFTYPEEFI
ncbi:phage/plasmid primase, P4 family [Vagococcus carniphilus]|uniref:DNA primase family protein n=1 Tax=Vagococcus carniphilus TaxID=218144 RepID=UPI0028922C1F|nr:phage/plasmid primase, P4 family [Vagococcus carniphilus]MDT2849726.1 phage/plasmid primase, P4 family [Vagococcus carniphilus]